MGKLLMELQVRKSTADAEGAKTYYETLTKPKDEWIGELRELVLFKKQVRGRLVYVGQR
jgi:dipeptidyl-peptidase III